jgi:hypothetical protein
MYLILIVFFIFTGHYCLALATVFVPTIIVSLF